MAKSPSWTAIRAEDSRDTAREPHSDPSAMIRSMEDELLDTVALAPTASGRTEALVTLEAPRTCARWGTLTS